ncbi:MAG: GGDEF domain-containing protein [Pirellulales bacterium]|nr:GGDEF domain-containing protein [Pirellulales bacterium]
MPWFIIFAAMLGSLLQIVLGIMLGLYVARWRRGGADAGEQDSHLVRLTGRVYALLQSMKNDVGMHHGEITAIEKELVAVSPAGSDGAGDLVTRMVRNILQSNARLRGQLHAAEEKLHEQHVQLEEYFLKARTDPLTNLPNRRAFDETQAQWMEQWRRGERKFGLILIDLDQLKMLNDQGGHLTGDYVLRGLGELLHEGLAAGEFAARLGGDEFAVLTANRDCQETCRRAEAIRLAVAKRRFYSEQRQWPVSVSIGVAQIGPGDQGTNLIRRADYALVAAKRAGRNCCFFHDDQLCRPISAADQSVEEDGLLLQLCDDLRQRVAIVAEQ